MASKNVPLYLREGYKCSPPSIQVPEDKVAAMASNHARPALRDLLTNRSPLKVK